MCSSREAGAEPNQRCGAGRDPGFQSFPANSFERRFEELAIVRLGEANDDPVLVPLQTPRGANTTGGDLGMFGHDNDERPDADNFVIVNELSKLEHKNAFYIRQMRR